MARRVAMIVILLLVIPLFLETFFLYRHEYRQRERAVIDDLKWLAVERAFFIDEMLEMDWNLLEQPSMQAAAERIPLPPNARDRFIALSKSRQAMLAGIAISSTDGLVLPIPFTVIGKDLPRAYPIRIALLNAEGAILWESASAAGEALSAEGPIDNTGIDVQLSVDQQTIRSLHLQSYYLHFAALVVFVGLLGCGAVYLFTWRTARPLRHLCKTMERVSDGASHARYTPDWMGFEINALGLQFNEALDGLLRHAGEAERERLHRERLAQEFSIGHEIQASLLPTHIPGFAGLDLASAYLAAKEVNGDFYDLFVLPNGQLLIAICDTAGKGISACLFSLGLRSILRSLASTSLSLSELVRKANDLYLIDAQQTSMFSTAWIGFFDPQTQQLTYCSQGHPPALLARGAQLEELWTEGIALGASKMDQIATRKITLKQGDFLVLYTDGIVEAHNPAHQLYGKQRLHERLMIKQKASAQQIADQILEDVQLFTQGAPQHDDITLIVIKILPR
ncbi:MAG: PP2C family protein-serine/threonine phosphatase [Verrucomicrobia bacterium]|nr:PP2C family protein-serine/threonine phosphatase [Verrucomicrobiota bacterium]